MPDTVTLATIETTAKKLRAARDELANLVTTLNRSMDALKDAAMPAIRKAVSRAGQQQAELEAQIDAARPLFIKPRTVLLHGVIIGLEKGKGKIEFEDEDQVIAAIRKKLPDQADTLVATEYRLVIAAMRTLSVAALESIGCTVQETGDRVVIRFADKEVDKTVKALLANAIQHSGSGTPRLASP